MMNIYDDSIVFCNRANKSFQKIEALYSAEKVNDEYTIITIYTEDELKREYFLELMDLLYDNFKQINGYLPQISIDSETYIIHIQK